MPTRDPISNTFQAIKDALDLTYDYIFWPAELIGLPIPPKITSATSKIARAFS